MSKLKLKKGSTKNKPLTKSTLLLILGLWLVFGRFSLADVVVGDAKESLYSGDQVQLAGHDLSDLMTLAYQAQKDAMLYKTLNAELSDALTVPESLRRFYQLPDRSKGLSTTQLVFILQKIPDLKVIVQNYLSSPTAFSLQKLVDRSKIVLQDPTIKATIQRLADPSQPVAVFPKAGGPGYKVVGTYLNHPAFKTPGDIHSEVIPGSDLVQKWVDFFDGADQELFINSYEFSDLKIANAVKRAFERGVAITLGVDKNTLERHQGNKDVWKLLSSINSPRFILTPVDPENINHQKIAARDPDGPKAGALISSGNLTPSCLDPRGNAFDQPDNHLLDGDIPNANHLIVLQGQLPAIIIRHELKKTIVDKLRGVQYPISGSYILYGEAKPGMQKPPFFMLAFSPNGGIGSINRDIITRTILGTNGPILAAQYAFASTDVLSALLERARRDKAVGREFDFSFVGETDFLMQFYSSALILAGYKFDQKTASYTEDSAAEIRKILTADEISKLRKQLRVAPEIYNDRYVLLPNGHKFKEAAVLHHKLWLFPGPKISTPGTSFNTSNAAEGNQEQIVVTNEPEVFDVLMGGVSYLYETAEHDIVKEIQLRTDHEASKMTVLPKLNSELQSKLKLKLAVKSVKCSQFYGH